MEGLTPKLFTEECADEVAGFDCGDEPWAKPLNDYIKSQLAVKSIRKGKIRIWLYHDSNGTLAGYGSLGRTNWPAIFPDDPKRPILILPNIAVDRRHQRKGYGKQICVHLIAAAQTEFAAKRGTDDRYAPMLGLLVDPRNDGAKSLYRSLGFRNYDYYYYDKDDDITYEGMALLLDAR